MNIWDYLVMVVGVAMLSLCAVWIITDVPIIALIGLVFSSFILGFILGENTYIGE